MNKKTTKGLLSTAKWIEKSCASYIDIPNKYILVFCDNSYIDEKAIIKFVNKYKINDIAFIFPKTVQDEFDKISFPWKQLRIVVSENKMQELIELYNATMICSNIKYIGTNRDGINCRKILPGMEKKVSEYVLY